MGQADYKTCFKKNHWGKFGIDVCNNRTPELVEVEKDHFVACHRVIEMKNGDINY